MPKLALLTCFLIINCRQYVKFDFVIDNYLNHDIVMTSRYF